MIVFGLAVTTAGYLVGSGSFRPAPNAPLEPYRWDQVRRAESVRIGSAGCAAPDQCTDLKAS